MALGTFSAIKGLNFIVPTTSLYFYYTDYRFGFVPRGLIGQIFSPLLAAIPQPAHDDLLVVWHISLMAILILALSSMAARMVATTRRVDVLAMTVLVFCSPLIPSLAYFTAAPDVLLCILTLVIVSAVQSRRLVLAWTVFLLGTLAHHLMIFLAFPLLILGTLIHAEGRRVPHVIWLIVLGLAPCILIVIAPEPDANLVSRFVELGIPPSEAQSLLELQLGQTLSRQTSVMARLWREHYVNGLVAVTYGSVAGMAILIGGLAMRDAHRSTSMSLPSSRDHGRGAILSLMVIGAGLSPMLVLLIAWDLSRLAGMSIFTAFMGVTMLLGRPREPTRDSWSGNRFVTITCFSLAALFLMLPALGLWFTGSQLNTTRPMIPDPVLEIDVIRRAIDDVLAVYNRNRP